jgi:azobenzene reductase
LDHAHFAQTETKKIETYSMNITIISGSTRPGRTSHRVALALEKTLKSFDIEVSILDLQALDLPPFTERFQFMAEKPPHLLEAAARLQSSDALIFLTPEYNGGITSALKSCIDTFGKPEFGGKPIGVATASTGVMGGVRAAYQLQQTILALQAYPQPQMLLAGEVTKQLDENGEVINPAFVPKLEAFVKAFVGFASKFKSETATT